MKKNEEDKEKKRKWNQKKGQKKIKEKEIKWKKGGINRKRRIRKCQG